MNRTATLATALVLAGCAACGSGPHPAGTAAPSPTTSSTSTTTGSGTTTPPTTPPTSRAGTPAAPVVHGWATIPATPLPAMIHAVGVWDGRELLVVGESMAGPTAPRVGHAAAYDPASRHWRVLPAPSGTRAPIDGASQAVWTGTEMIVMGGNFSEAYNPATNRWRHITVPVYGTGEVDFAMVWTGRLLVLYGGGCCGGPSSGGAAYEPATGTWTKLGTALLGARWATGAWTGTEVVIAGGTGNGTLNGVDAVVDLRTAAAYNPATRTWRALPPMPVGGNGTAVWDGSRVVFLGGNGAVAWSPTTNRWTTLPKGFDDRYGFGVVRAGSRLVVWGGQRFVASEGERPDVIVPSSGLVYTRSGGWSRLPVSPLRGRLYPIVVWTGSRLLVWGGDHFVDGAAWTP